MTSEWGVKRDGGHWLVLTPFWEVLSSMQKLALKLIPNLVLQDNVITWEIKTKATVIHHFTFVEDTETLESFYNSSLWVTMWNSTITKGNCMAVHWHMIQQSHFRWRSETTQGRSFRVETWDNGRQSSRVISILKSMIALLTSTKIWKRSFHGRNESIKCYHMITEYWPALKMKAILKQAKA